MAITKMKHLRLFGMGADRQPLLEQLQKLGCVEIRQPTDQLADPQWAALTQVDDGGLAQAKQEAGQLQSALAALERSSPEKTGLLTPRRAVRYQELFDEELRGRALQAAQIIAEQERIIGALQSEQAKLATQKLSLIPWLSLDVPLETQGSQEVSATFGTLMAITELPTLMGELQAVTPLVEIIPAGADREFQYILLLCHRSAEEAVFEALKPAGFSRATLRGWTGTAVENVATIDRRIQEIQSEREVAKVAIAGQLPARPEIKVCLDRMNQDIQRETMKGYLLESQATFFLEGWCPAEKIPALEALLSQYTTAWESRDPQPEEYPQVPVQLRNNFITKPLNMVTEMYALPAYNGLDPNPLMAPFFILFYGLMMADMGYGILMMLAGALVLHKAKPKKGMYNFAALALLCGISTFIMGAITGGFFGDFIPQAVLLITGQVISLPSLFTPLDDALMVLIGSLILGTIQVVTAMIISIVKQARRGETVAALCNEGAWLAVFAVFGLGAAVNQLTVAGIVAGVILVVTQSYGKEGILGKVLGIFGSLYNNITGFFSDILSYSRLMALMLAGAVIAQVFNTLAALTGNIVTFVIIAMVGNALNFALNLLSCYVHDLRLQCLEYFGRFYEDGGKAFEPLQVDTKYVDVIE